MRYRWWFAVFGLALSACSPSNGEVVGTTIGVVSTTSSTGATTTTDQPSSTTSEGEGPNASISDIVEACLEDLGYEIEDPPSLQAFIDSYDTGPWHPYLSLPLDAPHAELERACPVEAP